MPHSPHASADAAGACGGSHTGAPPTLLGKCSASTGCHSSGYGEAKPRWIGVVASDGAAGAGAAFGSFFFGFVFFDGAPICSTCASSASRSAPSSSGGASRPSAPPLQSTGKSSGICGRATGSESVTVPAPLYTFLLARRPPAPLTHAMLAT